ncbi:MAG: putative glycoside hydrolase [bacterium]|nr:putative glycoside hydrolase [bacterium]
MRLRFALLILTACLLLPQAAFAEGVYPRLANYFLKYEMTSVEAKELARWDLLILDMEIQENNPELIVLIRKLNPNVKILAYITSQEIIDNPSQSNSYLRAELASGIIEKWRLKDDSGRRVVNWPFTSMLNLTERASQDASGYRFNEYLARFIKDEIKSSGLWDGVFYDNIWGDVAWINGGNLDFDSDGQRESKIVADSLWAEGVTKLLRLTRELCGNDFLIMGNGRVHWPYQSTMNGMMLEGFPPSWENGGTWQGSMETYLKLPTVNASPVIPVINIYEKNKENYRLFRFGLASALLGDGYYSFDYDVTNHGQTWWYDEYDVGLGSAQSPAYNILNGGKSDIQPGLWRRDFKNGVAIVNSTDKTQSFTFSKEEFEKIKGTQAPTINNGQRINFLKLEPRDGIILLKKLTAWQGSGFTNGGFLRIFTPDGKQARNGFFSYISSLPSGSEVVIESGNGEEEYIYSASGLLYRQRNGKIHWQAQPFAAGFKGATSVAIGDVDGNGKLEIVIGAGHGGGPQVRVFTLDGKPISNFFAYDKNFRGGVNVAVGDVDGDGKAEIITGAGTGGGPHVRYFNHQGKVIGSFFAYDKNFRGGVNVAVGDVNGDGKAEIITGAGPGGGPQVRIFAGTGVPISSFFAFEENFRDGVRVGFSLKTGQPEIAVGIKGF